MTIGVKLRKLRTDHGFSQQRVADFLNISRNAYIAWENNTADLTIGKLQCICNLYEIKFLDFFSGDIENFAK